MKKWLMGLLFLAANAFAQPPMMTKVIELHYQNADQLIQLLQPLLQPDEKISGSGQRLIVKVTAITLTQLRAMLHKLDQAPVRFEITVFQADPDWLNRQNNKTISISTSSRANQERRQSIQVMDGESAFVSTGQDQPILSSVSAGYWDLSTSYQRRLVQNSLDLKPVLQGQHVKLAIRRLREQVSQGGTQQFDHQELATTVWLPLNQWVSLASAEGKAAADSGTKIYHAGNQFSKNSTLYIKVGIVEKTTP